MKVKTLVGALIFLVVLNLAAVSTFVYFSRTPPPGHGRQGRGPGGGPPGIELFVNMSDEDRAQLRELAMDFRESTSDLHERSRALEDEVFALMREDNVDRARVDSLVSEIGDVRVAIGRTAIDHLIEAKTFLTPEQQELFHNMIMRQSHGRMDRPGFERGRGQGGRKGRGGRPRD